MDDRRGGGEQERDDRQADDEQLDLGGRRRSAHIEPPRGSADQQGASPPRKLSPEIKLHKTRGEIPDHDGESRGSGEEQRNHVDAERGKARGAAPRARHVVAHRPGPARLRRVKGHDKGEGDHTQGSEEDGERTDRPGQGGDDAKEERDIDERADAEALPDQLHQSEARVVQLARWRIHRERKAERKMKKFTTARTKAGAMAYQGSRTRQRAHKPQSMRRTSPAAAATFKRGNH